MFLGAGDYPHPLPEFPMAHGKRKWEAWSSIDGGPRGELAAGSAAPHRRTLGGQGWPGSKPCQGL